MTETVKYRGRLSQIGIYFKKFLRMFVYQSDWKVLPIGAIIAALVTFVIGSNMFVTQEGTTTGTFALTCVCIWNGLFNSIQVVCRERDIVKREHRAGMHISSYVVAHMLYQLLLCALQTIVTILICTLAGVHFPEVGIIFPAGIADVFVTILLVTYSADLMALMISCIVKTTTSAMTVVPFLLIFQLIFSGGLFDLGSASLISAATISHWGMNALSALGQFNSLPMVSLWNMLVQFKDIDLFGYKPLLAILQDIEKNDMVTDFTLWSGSFANNPDYASTVSNMWVCWGAMILLIVIFVVISIIALKFVDRDKR